VFLEKFRDNERMMGRCVWWSADLISESTICDSTWHCRRIWFCFGSIQYSLCLGRAKFWRELYDAWLIQLSF